MNAVSLGDVIMWFALGFVFFRAMDASFRPTETSGVQLQYPNWIPPAIKAAVLVCPIVLTLMAPGYRDTPIWNFVCLACIVVFVGPVAFPQLGVDLTKLTLGDRVVKWLLSRVDIGAKKAILIAALTWVLPDAFAMWLAAQIPLPAYFSPRSTGLIGPFSAAVIVVAFISVLMRALLIGQLSKPLAIFLMPIGLMLMGYVMDAGASLRLTSTAAAYSASVMLAIVIDLGMFLAVSVHIAKD